MLLGPFPRLDEVRILAFLLPAPALAWPADDIDRRICDGFEGRSPFVRSRMNRERIERSGGELGELCRIGVRGQFSAAPRVGDARRESVVRRRPCAMEALHAYFRRMHKRASVATAFAEEMALYQEEQARAAAAA